MMPRRGATNRTNCTNLISPGPFATDYTEDTDEVATNRTNCTNLISPGPFATDCTDYTDGVAANQRDVAATNRTI